MLIDLIYFSRVAGRSGSEKVCLLIQSGGSDFSFTRLSFFKPEVRPALTSNKPQHWYGSRYLLTLFFWSNLISFFYIESIQISHFHRVSSPDSERASERAATVRFALSHELLMPWCRTACDENIASEWTRLIEASFNKPLLTFLYSLCSGAASRTVVHFALFYSLAKKKMALGFEQNWIVSPPPTLPSR